MKTQMRKWGVLVVLLAVLVSGIAAALVEPKHLSLETRVRRVEYPVARPAATNVDGGTDNIIIGISALGIDGGFADSGVAIDGGPTTFVNVPDGGDAGPGTVAYYLRPPAAPSQLDIILVDVSANSTLTCASVTITGYNQFGAKVVETVSTVSETVKSTNNAFSQVLSVQMTGCAGGTSATDDYLRVSGSIRYALPLRARQVGDIVSVCVRDQAALDAGASQVICFGGTQLAGYSATDLTYNVVKMDDGDIAPLFVNVGLDAGGLNTGDLVIIEELPNPALP